MHKNEKSSIAHGNKKSYDFISPSKETIEKLTKKGTSDKRSLFSKMKKK